MPANVLIDGFRLPDGAAPVACVDIGGTKVAVSVADAQGIRGRVTEPTAKEGNNDALGYQIIRLIGESCVSVGLSAADVSAVGVSSCGPFVIHDGCIELTAPNICGGMAGKAPFSKRHCVPGLARFGWRMTVLARWKPNADGVRCKSMARLWIIAPTSPGVPALAWDCAWTAGYCMAKMATLGMRATCL